MTITQASLENNSADNTKIAVALSGGVDSAVAAALLQAQGYEVEGFFMKNWSDEAEAAYRRKHHGGTPGRADCPWLDDMEDVSKICEQLGIPWQSFNFEKEYREKVFTYFLDEYTHGRTPNPDVLCNTEIKFKSFLKRAMDLGFTKVATGHYARINTTLVQHTLRRGADQNKDQTYFIYHLGQAQLSQLVFPIGHLQKTEVRGLAKQFHLPVADKKDSQGLCFIGDIDFPTFLEQYIPHTPGPMILTDGTYMGQHRGLEYYTIGQRYGIGIGGSGPYFVVDKSLSDNSLIICQGIDHPSLFADHFAFSDEHWIAGTRPGETFDCTVKLRYRSPDVRCTVKGTTVRLHNPERAVTPGQFAVFYDGDIVLGGAVIISRSFEKNDY